MDTEWVQKITIEGRAPAGASRFSVYLQDGEELEPYDIAFCLDFRFSFACHARTIVTNHRRDGAWQNEETGYDGFPLYEEEDFKIKIYIHDDCFRVKVNGEELVQFEQMLSNEKINCLRIDNDVELYKVKLK